MRGACHPDATAAPAASATAPSEPLPNEPRTEQFQGTSFSITYPAGFTIETAEVDKGAYTDTTIRSAADAATLLRIDMSPDTREADPEVIAAPNVRSMSRQNRYRAIGFDTVTVAGFPAVRWEFVVREHGVLLHKLIWYFATDAQVGVALMAQAPATRWGKESSRLVRALESIDLVPGYGG